MLKVDFPIGCPKTLGFLDILKMVHFLKQLLEDMSWVSGLFVLYVQCLSVPSQVLHLSLALVSSSGDRGGEEG